MTCYTVMLLGGMVQFLLLLGAARLCGCAIQHWRALMGAVFGGLYAGVCLLPMTAFLAQGIWRLVWFAAVVILVFGIKSSALRCGAVFVLLNMALEGISVGSNGRSWYSIVAVALLGILCLVGFSGGDPAQLIPIEVCYGDKTMQLTALQDTGNLLKDPITGGSVVVVSPSVANRMMGLTPSQLRSPLDAITSAGIPGLRLIPYSTVGQKGNFLLAVRMQVKQGKQMKSCLVAFAPEGFCKKGQYEALTGGNV